MVSLSGLAVTKGTEHEVEGTVVKLTRKCNTFGFEVSLLQDDPQRLIGTCKGLVYICNLSGRERWQKRLYKMECSVKLAKDGIGGGHGGHSKRWVSWGLRKGSLWRTS